MSPWIWGLIPATLGLLLLVVSYNPTHYLPQRSAPASFTVDGRAQNYNGTLVTSSVSPAPAPPAAKAEDASVNGPMIVRTADLQLTTKDFDKARARLENILKRHRGYIAELNVSSPAGAGRVLSATLRVPADQLDATVADLKLLGRVDSESQGGEEVTRQYVDLEARLANARNTEQRLTELLRNRTGKLSDVLAVEVEIGRVRGEIEEMEAQRKTLTNQIDFATLTTRVAEDYSAQLQVMPTSTLTRLRNSAVEGYGTMVASLINVALFLIAYGPSLLLWCAIAFFPVRSLWRRLRRTRAHA